MGIIQKTLERTGKGYVRAEDLDIPTLIPELFETEVGGLVVKHSAVEMEHIYPIVKELAQFDVMIFGGSTLALATGHYHCARDLDLWCTEASFEKLAGHFVKRADRVERISSVQALTRYKLRVTYGAETTELDVLCVPEGHTFESVLEMSISSLGMIGYIPKTRVWLNREKVSPPYTLRQGADGENALAWFKKHMWMLPMPYQLKFETSSAERDEFVRTTGYGALDAGYFKDKWETLTADEDEKMCEAYDLDGDQDTTAARIANLRIFQSELKKLQNL